jgi:hypothetical protein
VPSEQIQISFLDPVTHRPRRMRLHEAVSVPFATVPPVRKPQSYRGQQNKPGVYWFSKTRRHVQYESRLEQLTLTLLDFDPDVVAVSAQPFKFHATEPHPKSHVPDFFVERRAAAPLVVETKLRRYRNHPKVRATTALGQRACDEAGWEYAIADLPDLVPLTNILWLAGFRRCPADPYNLAAPLRAACAEPRSISHLEAEVGPPLFLRPLLFHLLWTGALITDLSQRLSLATEVVCA